MLEKLKHVANVVLGVLLLMLLLFGIYKGGAWIFHNVDMTPKSLAVASLALIFLPITLTMALASQTKSAYTSGPAAYAVMVLPVGILGLVASGAWYLLEKIF